MAGENQGAVKLYGTWLSPFSRRVEFALKLKGVSYEHIEEDLSNKSSDLIKYNPVHKKIPVLVHNEKPIVESLVILEYIDETWKNNPILSTDPYEKAVARFWGSFIDTKILATSYKVPASKDDKEKEEVLKEVREHLKTLENQLKGKDFFGGDKIGYVDIAAMVIAFWFPVVQEALGGQQFYTSDQFPDLFKWSEKLRQIDLVNECRPPKDRHIAAFKARFDAMKNAPN